MTYHMGLATECTDVRTRDHTPSELFRLWRSGDNDALRRLLPLVYEELRRIARRHLRRERPDHTLQTTALIHEAYLRLVDQGSRRSATAATSSP